jgi:NAD(P)H-dependent FMN reductase
VAPEYNHSFPGLLKHVLDTCLEEYIHKAAGIVGVSAGPFGGTRVVQSLLPVLRELGLMTTFTDLNFSKVGDAFDEGGKILDQAVWSKRTTNFLDELLWMSAVLRYGRENISQE